MDEASGLNIEQLAVFLTSTINQRNPSKIVSYEVKSAAAAGENFASDVFRVKILFELKSGKRQFWSTIVKRELPLEQNIFAPFKLFHNEINAYSNIFPLFVDLMEEFGDKRGPLWAEMYGYAPNWLISFEDLTDSMFVVPDRRNCLDLNHLKMVLRSIARYHAMSKVLLKRGSLNQSHKGQWTLIRVHEVVNQMWWCLATVLANTIADEWESEWLPVSESLLSLAENFTEKANALNNHYDDKFEVLNHGDLWTCNMMVQYLEYENSPTSVRFVDLQDSNINSFIWDVEYFLFTSGLPEVRREHYDDLHRTYQQALEDNLKFFKFDGYIPTLEDVKSESKRVDFAKIGFLLLNCVIRADDFYAFDMAKMLTHPPNEVVHKVVFSSEQTRRSMEEDLKYFVQSGVL